jgi:multicomponent Na+:H+ antiporter subunit A
MALTAGTALFYGAQRTRWWRALRLPAGGESAYLRLMGWLDRLAVEVTSRTQRGSLPFYLGVILVLLVGFAGGALVAGWPWPDRVRAFDTPLQLVAGGVVVAAAVFAARAQRRLTAMILVGVSGYAVAALFVLHGAPDLALTQFLVETVTIVMFVLVLRRLPARFSERPLRAVRRTRVAIGVAVGLVTAGMAYVAVSGRQVTPVSTEFPDIAVSFGGGKNVVNVTLVDIRAWDTMGEISVLVVAATGVASLIYARTQALRRRGATRPPATPDPGEVRWLMAGSGPEAGRSAIILQVVTRLIFHVIVLFSVFLLFSGHNAPGGGFAAGLVAGLALAVRYLAGGRAELSAAAPVDAGRVLGIGLFVAVGTAAAAMLLGGEVLQSALLEIHLPVLGQVHLVTSVLFDMGVYLVVIGLVLDILRSLGAEVDRQLAGQPAALAEESV